jgi:hypothetical protein
MAEPTEPDEATREAEHAEEGQAHAADRTPTPEEEAAAEHGYEESDEERKRVAEHYEEMTDIGANAKGEGRID